MGEALCIPYYLRSELTGADFSHDPSYHPRFDLYPLLGVEFVSQVSILVEVH